MGHVQAVIERAAPWTLSARASAAPWRRTWLPLLIILLFGAALRLLYVDAPLLDAHRWRQVDTAQIARSFYEDEFNLLKPQVNWGGVHGYVESEFPLLPGIVAVLYMIFGPDETWGRLVVIVFSLGCVALTYALTRRLLTPAAGLAAAALVAVSPAAVFYGRTFMPDTLMVFFSLGALLGFVDYVDTRRTATLALGSASLALAILVKLPGVLVVAPIVAVLWAHRRTINLRNPRLLLALIVPALVAAAWYLHAYGIYKDTGLTFGIIGTTKEYPPAVVPGPWPDAFPKWSSVALLTDPSFYTTILSRLYFLHLTPPGFALALVGIFVSRRLASRFVADAWLLALLAFILAAGAGNVAHDYYQLPAVPIFALYFAAVAWPVFDGDWIRRTIGSGWSPRVALGAALAGIAIMSLWQSGVIERHFRPDTLDMRTAEAGGAVANATDDGELIVVVDDYGVNSPMLLYYAHARGWSLDARTITAPVLRGLQYQGARYFATTRWTEVQREQPDLVMYLATKRRLALPGAPPDMALFDVGVMARRTAQ